MKNIITIVLLISLPLLAQDITNKLGTSGDYEITDSSDNLLLRLRSDNGLLVKGTFGTGTIPIEGAGERLMWYPAKAAFRVGAITNSFPFYDVTQWNDTNIGAYSVAMGRNTTASSDYCTALGSDTKATEVYATAIGQRTVASGASSTAMGAQTTASGGGATAMGGSTTASGSKSTAMGYETIASGDYSTSMGRKTIASGEYSTAIGRGIEASGENSVAIALNNQSGTNVSQANTMSIMGGSVGIGTTTPNATLDIHGTV